MTAAPTSRADQCNDAASTDDKWPASRIEQLLQLSDAQHATLDKVQLAANDAVKTIKSNCRQLGDLSPPDRLRALVQALWVVRDGDIAMRAPLKNFYESLTSAQKNSFAVQQPQNTSPPGRQDARRETSNIRPAPRKISAARSGWSKKSK